MNDGYKAVADLFRSKKSFLVTSHIDPDGDAIGSSLAIYSILKRLGREVKVVLEDFDHDISVFDRERIKELLEETLFADYRIIRRKPIENTI